MAPTPRYQSAIVNTAASGDTTLVAAVAGQAIAVVGLLLVAAGAVTVVIKDGSTGLTGAISLVAGQPLVLVPERAPIPWFTTTPGQALVITLGGAVQVSGRVYYRTG